MIEEQEEANNSMVDEFSPQRNKSENLINEVANLKTNSIGNNIINKVANLTINDIINDLINIFCLQTE